MGEERNVHCTRERGLGVCASIWRWSSKPGRRASVGSSPNLPCANESGDLCFAANSRCKFVQMTLALVMGVSCS